MGKYKTEPIKCWAKAKELRRSVYEHVAKARDDGKIIVAGGTESMLALPAGYDMEFLGGEPYGARTRLFVRSSLKQPRMPGTRGTSVPICALGSDHC